MARTRECLYESPAPTRPQPQQQQPRVQPRSWRELIEDPLPEDVNLQAHEYATRLIEAVASYKLVKKEINQMINFGLLTWDCDEDDECHYIALKREAKNLKDYQRGTFLFIWRCLPFFTKTERVKIETDPFGHQKEIMVRGLKYPLSHKVSVIFKLLYINGEEQGIVSVTSCKRH